MKTVLIVDDSIFMQTWLTDIVHSSKSFKVIATVQNGRDAIEEYKKRKPDITLLDITLPDVSGITVLKEIIKFDANAKVLMCSSLGAKNQIIETLKIGAKDFIVKPYFDHLIEKLDRIDLL